MTKNLVIVESPTKAKTIEKFLGKDFTVKSSFGHVRDLSKKDMGVDIEKDFNPDYIIPDDKKKIIQDLKKLAKEAEIIWLASDEDREGEAISWHLVKALGLKENQYKRIAFHEITKEAITNAIENPRELNINLVDAQQARRVLDRLVGFEISPVLWKKVKPALSAGRVQSATVRLVVEREKEIENFTSKSSYKVNAIFEFQQKDKKGALKAELSKRFDTKEEAKAFLEKCNSSKFLVEDIETKPYKKSAAAPFTTSTLQQEASRKLGFSVSKTMLIAQKLYESGKITYMRTDSVNLSELALNKAKEVIQKSYGKEYSLLKKYITKIKGAQEAHEAIRPSYLENQTIEGDDSERRLYDLIWKRTIASQMAEAIIEKTVVTIGLSNAKEKFTAKGEVIKFDGFLKVYMESTDDDSEENENQILPQIEKSLPLDLIEAIAIQRFTQHPPRYNEASLVKKLEDLGIGRPSTYAPTISTIQKRGYVVNENREGIERSFVVLELKNNKIKESLKQEIIGKEKSKLFPTDIGILVNDFLIKNFNEIVDYGFTANVEKEFDEIAQGTKVWNSMIKGFYSTFHNQVVETLEKSEKVKGERLLGIDPVSKRNVYAKLGRYGAIIQIGETDDIDKPKFAGLRKGQSLEKIALDEAMELFKLPREVGSFEDEPMTAAIGRFGPYIKHKNAFYSIPKTEDPLDITAEKAIEIIVNKRESDSNKIIKDFKDKKETRILVGRWGPYIKQGKNNFKIPKEKKAEDLSLEDCLEIIESNETAEKSKPKKTKKK